MITSMQREDFATLAWKRFTDDLTLRLADLRVRNDNPAHAPDQTALIRGQIKEVKRILDLARASSGKGEVADD